MFHLCPVLCILAAQLLDQVHIIRAPLYDAIPWCESQTQQVFNSHFHLFDIRTISYFFDMFYSLNTKLLTHFLALILILRLTYIIVSHVVKAQFAIYIIYLYNP